MSCFVIAEAGVNHNGSEELAMQMVDIAATAGADAIKFQTFDANSLACLDAPAAQYQTENTGNTNQYQMLKKLELSFAAHVNIRKYCNERRIEFISTPFDEKSADMLINLEVAKIKISSGDLTNTQLLRHIAKSNIPIILSTGMGTLAEVTAAVAVISRVRSELNFKQPLKEKLSILHCTSNYPAALEDINLKAMLTMQHALGLPVGYSDHSLGILVSLIAVGMGAEIIEKHFTVSRHLSGPDHKASLEPVELQEMVSKIRDVEKILGDGIKQPKPSEIPIRNVARRGLYTNKKLTAGTILSEKDIVSLRPESNISSSDIELVIGKKIKNTVGARQALEWSNLE